MPRTNIATQDASDGLFPWSGTGLALTEVAADAANLNECAACGRLLIVARNAGGSSRTVTVTSSPDPRFGRSGNATATLGAGAIWMHTIVREGWVQTGDLFHFQGSHADVKFSLVKLET